MKAIKRIVEVTLTIIAGISLILACAEQADGTISMTWSLGWMAVLFISAKILERMGTFDREESR